VKILLRKKKTRAGPDATIRDPPPCRDEHSEADSVTGWRPAFMLSGATRRLAIAGTPVFRIVVSRATPEQRHPHSHGKQRFVEAASARAQLWSTHHAPHHSPLPNSRLYTTALSPITSRVFRARRPAFVRSSVGRSRRTTAVSTLSRYSIRYMPIIPGKVAKRRITPPAACVYEATWLTRGLLAARCSHERSI